MPRRRSRDPRTDPGAALGAELSKAREAAGYATQEALAKALGYVREQVSKVESGGELPSDPLFAKWLDACRVPAARRQYLTGMLAMARVARSAIPDFAKPWLEAEAEADYLQLWSFVTIPGLLQTPRYAHAMFILGGHEEEAAAAKAAARIDRQAILTGPDATRVTLIIHESALYCLMDTPEIMAEQLESLLKAARQPGIIIQVVRDTGYFFGLEGEFMIASGREIPDTLNIVGAEDRATTEPVVVDREAARFERIRGHALTIEASRAIIQEALQRWNSQRQAPAGVSPATATAARTTA
jgi:transcriptional regulator with XRE-family HTH domain